MKNIRVLHRNILEVAIVFDEVCRANSISYYLLGGTALGAARHGGFIPWDDDFDVCMDYPNYQKMLRLFDDFKARGCTLIPERSTEFGLYFSKVKLDDSFYLERESDRGVIRHSGVFIDVMCVSEGYNLAILRRAQFLAAKALNASALSGWGYETTSFVKRITIFLSSLIVRGFVERALLYFVRQPKLFKSGKFLNHFFGRAPFSGSCIPIDYVGKGALISFEGVSFSSFTNIKGYLLLRFGARYMDTPSNSILKSYPTHCIEFKPRSDLKEPL